MRNDKPMFTTYSALLHDLGCRDTKQFAKKLCQLIGFLVCAYISIVFICALGGGR